MRTETTELLGEILKRTRLQKGYYASEVTLDYGSDKTKRVDFLQFVPAHTFSVSGIEQGEFICYEVKSCLEDIYSGNGLNFYGDKNYIVMNMETYKSFMDDFADRVVSRGLNAQNRKFWPWYKENHPYGMTNIGILVAVPKDRKIYDEFENPTEFDDDTDWRLESIQSSLPQPRLKSVTELLFCMLRSGK